MLRQKILDVLDNQIIDSGLESSEILDIILDVISGELIEKGFVTIDGFGDFTTHKRDEYIALNSKTKERLLMPPAIEIAFVSHLSIDDLSTDSNESDESVVLTFDPDPLLKSSVNSAFANFEPTVLNEGVVLPGLLVLSDAIEESGVDDVQDTPDVQNTPDPPSISHTRTNRVLVPIIGGVAIAMAALFFFSANPNKRNR